MLSQMSADDGAPMMQVGALRQHCVRLFPQRPKLTIVSRLFGASGQPWMWRQVVGLSDFRKDLICWERHNAETQRTSDVTEHVLAGDPAPYDGADRWSYRLRNAFSGNFYAALGRERTKLEQLLADDPPDVILCYFGDIAMRVLPAARSVGVPLVAYFHGDFSFQRNRWYRLSLLQCLRHFSAILVVTSSERSWLIESGVPEDKIHLIPCGAPVDLFSPNPSRAPGPVKFVMASRLSDDKGCDVSIEAFAWVAARDRDALLSVFGDGPQRDSLERLTARLGLAERVTFHGYVGENHLARAIPTHDVFIQHSRIKEGSPVSIVEAMACGLPVISTPVGGIVDQVLPEETGVLIAEGDKAAMAQAMLRMAADPALRRRLGESARKRALANYDSVRLTERLSNVLMSRAMARSLGQRTSGPG